MEIENFRIKVESMFETLDGSPIILYFSEYNSFTAQNEEIDNIRIFKTRESVEAEIKLLIDGHYEHLKSITLSIYIQGMVNGKWVDDDILEVVERLSKL